MSNELSGLRHNLKVIKFSIGRIWLPCEQGCPGHWRRWLVAFVSLAAALTPDGRQISAQEALRNSLAGDAAAEARQRALESQPYTFRTGDFKLLAVPSLELDYCDNIRLSHDDPQDDFILRPLLRLTGSYPVTRQNILFLNVGIGYDKYFSHDDLSRFRLESGSQLSFDLYIKDFWINFHDRFQYLQDPAQEASVTGTARYGSFQNLAGLTGTWDLRDLTLTLGYDHLNFIATSSEFSYLDHNSEMPVARAGFRLHPQLTIGVEGTAAFTTYDERVLNDNANYSAGIYGDWRPGSRISVRPRFGYTIYDFDQTSLIIPAKDEDGWYAGLTIAHRPTEAIGYSVSAGHETRLGVESDLIEDWYLRPTVTWDLLKDVSLRTSFFYEHGKQSGARFGSLSENNYDWYGGTFGVGYQVMRKVRLDLNYRFTLRGSDVSSREYTQNLVGLNVTYTPR